MVWFLRKSDSWRPFGTRELDYRPKRRGSGHGEAAAGPFEWHATAGEDVEAFAALETRLQTGRRRVDDAHQLLARVLRYRRSRGA